jgi:hypothetical protein
MIADPRDLASSRRQHFLDNCDEADVAETAGSGFALKLAIATSRG